ncbi:MAG: type IX secretion system sortase PorU [Bacteroidetes bacterium]|nr:type IX secretion system sortase PorU [Bacteroidota bacterium]
MLIKLMQLIKHFPENKFSPAMLYRSSCGSYSLHMAVLFVGYVLLLSSIHVQAEEPVASGRVSLNWQRPDTLHLPGKTTLFRPYFDGAVYNHISPLLPQYAGMLPVMDERLSYNLTVMPVQVDYPDPEEISLPAAVVLPATFETNVETGSSRDLKVLRWQVNSLRQTVDGRVERLLAFDYTITAEYPQLWDETDANAGAAVFADHSVLASGRWFKFRVSNTGIHRITAANLQAMGISTAGLDPRNIRIYGNGGGVLPEPNSAPRIDDLAENAILVVGEEDGVFNSSDYILFYAKGPVRWDFNPSTAYYEHTPAYYDDYAYYFITTDLGPGKRVQMQQSQGEVQQTISDFIDYKVAEQDLVNLSNTGRTWYGELFDITLSRDYPFDFPNLVASRPARVEAEVAARNFGPAGFQLYVDGQLRANIPIEPTQATGYDYAKNNGAAIEVMPSGNGINVNLRFTRSVSSARGWLDYIRVNAWRNLVFQGGQLLFGNHRTIPQGDYLYQITGSGSGLQLWDVTDHTNAVARPLNPVSGGFSFAAPAQTRRNFVLFDNSSFFSIENVGPVANQNLHSVRDIDYLIISHPSLIDEANRLAEFHRQHSGLTVYVTTPGPIYNEFSSGAQDVTAIRDFARMLYTASSPGKQLRYLLLFGDASFDYKDKLNGNNNLVPTYQTISSLNLVLSIATDDYYGFLDPNEGGTGPNLLDIGIGRFPVTTLQEARQMVDKVLRYVDKNPETFSEWRNELVFVADDGDSNWHMKDAEELVAVVEQRNPPFNINKFYIDAYPQIATPSGQKAPAVNEAINSRMERGALLVNYSGHGGEVGWAEERILEISDIQSWRNRNRMPVFITATCEFSRYDDPSRLSAGEMVFLNPDGGAIAMFTTARATYASTNLRLNKAIYNNNIFEPYNGERARFGDIMRRSKIAGDANDRKFVLLGDPALQLTYPEHLVQTTHINDKALGSIGQNDTIKALSEVRIRGKITSRNGQTLQNFDGKVFTTIYDKAATITTAGDQNGFPQTFTTRNSIIYKGVASVINGHFEFSFIVPKDISYRFGTGRISHYATGSVGDAHGSTEDFIVGGFSGNLLSDDKGPEIRLFMGDTTFRDGGFTSENPVLIALLRDESGINTTGAGIGHDIVAWIEGATERMAILNDYYTAALDKSNEGSVSFPIIGLNPGRHTITLRAWDVLNNSNTASISFEVIPKNTVTVNELFNYPNPFRDRTCFVFNHNQNGERLAVVIDIFDMDGRRVKSIREEIVSSSFRSQPICWDGKADSGTPVPKGLYLYRLIVTGGSGNQTVDSGRMVRF